MCVYADVDFDCSPDAVGDVRRLPRGLLREWGVLSDPAVLGLAEDVELVVAELASNAVAFGRDRCTLDVAAHRNRFRVTVADDGDLFWTPRPGGGTISPLAESGRGLTIVRALAHEWGAERNSPTGTVVWAQWNLPATQALEVPCWLAPGAVSPSTPAKADNPAPSSRPPAA